MAKVDISKWDVAEAFGLEYSGYGEVEKDGYLQYFHKFELLGKPWMNVFEDWEVNGSVTAKEKAAKIFLERIAKLVVQEKSW